MNSVPVERVRDSLLTDKRTRHHALLKMRGAEPHPLLAVAAGKALRAFDAGDVSPNDVIHRGDQQARATDTLWTHRESKRGATPGVALLVACHKIGFSRDTGRASSCARPLTAW